LLQTNYFRLFRRPFIHSKGEAWNTAVALENIKTDADAKFDEEINFEASDIEPMITYGTNPGMGLEFLKVSQLKDVAEGRNL
jgi:3-isopropylmalate/(R)-2-methylmalate dehydratase large subunit